MTNFESYKTAYVEKDARDRSWRTLLQNIPLDIVIVVGPVLYELIAGWDGNLSRAYWYGAGVGLAKTIGLAVIAYYMRKRVPPKNTDGV